MSEKRVIDLGELCEAVAHFHEREVVNDGHVSSCDACGDTGIMDSYGAFCGGDPRLFFPDPECSTEHEREAHAKACAAWNAGDHVRIDPAHRWMMLGDSIAHVTFEQFGLGEYTVTCFCVMGLARDLAHFHGVTDEEMGW